MMSDHEKHEIESRFDCLNDTTFDNQHVSVS